MHNNQKLKRIAQIAASGKTIPTDIEAFVLTCLNKLELKTFLHYYKTEMSKNRVFVTSGISVSTENLSQIKKMYGADREIISLVDEDLGAGIRLQNDDLVVDFTFKKYINETIERLKN